MIENPVTGERITFTERSDDVLRWEATWPTPGPRAMAHRHPVMEERWTVLEGRIVVEIDGKRHEAGPGEMVVAAPGCRHMAWNHGPGPARVEVEMRPGLRWAEFTERLFSGEDPIALVTEYADEIQVDVAP